MYGGSEGEIPAAAWGSWAASSSQGKSGLNQRGWRRRNGEWTMGLKFLLAQLAAGGW